MDNGFNRYIEFVHLSVCQACSTNPPIITGCIECSQYIYYYSTDICPKECRVLLSHATDICPTCSLEHTRTKRVHM